MEHRKEPLQRQFAGFRAPGAMCGLASVWLAWMSWGVTPVKILILSAQLVRLCQSGLQKSKKPMKTETTGLDESATHRGPSRGCGALPSSRCVQNAWIRPSSASLRRTPRACGAPVRQGNLVWEADRWPLSLDRLSWANFPGLFVCSHELPVPLVSCSLRCRGVQFAVNFRLWPAVSVVALPTSADTVCGSAHQVFRPAADSPPPLTFCLGHHWQFRARATLPWHRRRTQNACSSRRSQSFLRAAALPSATLAYPAVAAAGACLAKLPDVGCGGSRA